MNNQNRKLHIPTDCHNRSTLLIPELYFKRYFWHTRARKMGVACLVHQLLNDPRRDQKLRFLKSQKLKKVYQTKGQKLVRVNFYPDEEDWAKLSLLSNATGFSRCYIFVYLMLFFLGVNRLSNGGTPPTVKYSKWNHITLCSLILDLRLKKMTRILQT